MDDPKPSVPQIGMPGEDPVGEFPEPPVDELDELDPDEQEEPGDLPI